MSYDLYFQRDQPFTIQEFNNYFADRPHCKMEATQAWYSNEGTGVYFSFEHGGPAEANEEVPAYVASFNLNYYRPHIFGLEAVGEVAAFVREFGFGVYDPQVDGMSDGRFTGEGFLRGWNTGNEFGYSAILNSEDAPDRVFARPTAELESIWKWAREKEEIQRRLGDDIFVPGIIWLEVDGQLVSAVVWPDAIPTLIPQVDMLLVPRKEFAPRQFFTKKEDRCLIPQGMVEGLLPDLDHGGFPLPCRRPTYVDSPKAVQDFVRGLTASTHNIQRIEVAQILNAEMVLNTKKGGGSP
jgi:hypothetical protein